MTRSGSSGPGGHARRRYGRIEPPFTCHVLNSLSATALLLRGAGNGLPGNKKDHNDPAEVLVFGPAGTDILASIEDTGLVTLQR